MSKFFRYHVEKKGLDAEIVQRCFALYLEQFDPDRCYLLEGECAPYLSITEKKAQAIALEMEKGNFSAFYELDALIARSIARADRLREGLFVAVLTISPAERTAGKRGEYARTEDELFHRMRLKLAQFYGAHVRHTKMDSPERKRQLVELFLLQIREKEFPYLGLHPSGEMLDTKEQEHMLSVRILKAFAKSLDAHSSYFSKQEALELRFHLEQQFEGFGIVIGNSIDGAFIVRIIPGSPAEQQGILAVNDRIVEIDGFSTRGLSFARVSDLMKKRASPQIHLGVQRQEAESVSDVFYVRLKKAPIVMDQERISVRYAPFGSGIIGCITLRSFYDNGQGVNSANDLQKAIAYLRSEGELQGLILDLRENGGGFLTQAVKVASLFMSSGVVVISKYGQDEIHYLRSIDPRKTYGGPLLVLTSKISASAAEIVAQSLQDYGLALVVGDVRTFGKGSIQHQTITSDNPDIYFKVTVGRYYTVSGKTTQMRGVIADIHIPTGFAPFSIGEEYLQHSLSPDSVPPAYEDSVADVDPRMHPWLSQHYLPYIQKKTTMYTDMLPHLRKNSQARIRKNPIYRAFLQNQDKIRKKLSGQSGIVIDWVRNFGLEELQVEEAMNVLKDIIYLQRQQEALSSEATR